MTRPASRAAIALALVAGTAIAAPTAVQGDVETVWIGSPVYTNLTYPEGTVFDGNALMFTDMKRGLVFRMTGGTPQPIWTDTRCGPTALAKLPSGQWLLACHLSHELVFLDLTNPMAPTVIARRPFRRPNDMYAWHLGVYVTRSGEFSRSAPVRGEVWLVKGPDDMRRVADGIHYANGVAVTRDDRFLLVSEHLERRVWRYPILPTGDLGERVPAFTFSATGTALALAGPDGIEPAPDGSFFVAIYWTGEVLRISPAGTVTGTVLTSGGYAKVTNIALTPDGHGLYAVASSEDETKGALTYVKLQSP